MIMIVCAVGDMMIVRVIRVLQNVLVRRGVAWLARCNGERRARNPAGGKAKRH